MPLQLGGIQGLEWIILLAFIIIILFGAKKLPELARSIGKATGEFQRGRQEIEKELKTISEAPKEESEKQRLMKAAQELGINTEGKTEEEIRNQIKEKLSEKESKTT